MQERVVSRDLKMALEAEKRNGLEALGKLGKERRARAELEVQLEALQRDLASGHGQDLPLPQGEAAVPHRL